MVDSRTYLLPGSGTKETLFLSQKSNVERPGQWLFKTSWPNMRHLNVEPADSFIPVVEPRTQTFVADQCKE